MRIGIFDLTAPPEMLPDRGFEWAIDEASRLGVQVVGDERPGHRRGPLARDRDYLRGVRAAANGKGIDIEPSIRSPFDLVGAGAAAARAATVESIRAARELGGPVVHAAYGNETLGRSRFAGHLAEHLEKMSHNLKEAARIADSEGVVLAIENHCDFSGREWASVLAEVASPAVMCKLDTANGLAIYADPVADAEALIPWTVTTHVKDLRVIQSPATVEGNHSTMPFTLVGCPVGDGIVDFTTIIRKLLSEGPLGRDVPLIVEPGWAEVAPGADAGATRNELVATNVQRIRRIVEAVTVPA